MNPLLHHLRRAALLSPGSGPSDGQLLEAFLNQRDESAFEALVRRHGPMVLSVCRRVVGNDHDAEDAFQATFIVLVRKAGTLRSRPLLAGWLYGVACRTAMKARAMSQKRRAKEKHAAEQPRPEAAANGVPEELLARLDEELNRLPERYRLPVVLCELQGQSRKQAAQTLGLPEGTLSWRLAHARKLLAQRLAPYGAMLSAGAVTAVLAESAAGATVPAALLRATTGVGMQLIAGEALATGLVPVPIHVLSEGVLKAMLLSKLKIVCGTALAVALGAAVVGWTYHSAIAADPQQERGLAARATADEIEELRLEVAALRKGLQATRERVKDLETQVTALQTRARRGRRGPGGGVGGPGGGMGAMMGGPPGMGGAGMGALGGGMGALGGSMGMMGGGLGGGMPPGMGPGGGPGMPGMGGMMPGSGGMHGMPAMPGMGPAGGERPSQHNKPKTPQNGTGAKVPSSAMQQMMQQMMGGRPAAEKQPPSSAGKGGSNGQQSGQEKVSEQLFRQLSQEHLKRGSAHDPLTRAEQALKRLRQHPDDKKAADDLERALQWLRLQQQAPESLLPKK